MIFFSKMIRCYQFICLQNRITFKSVKRFISVIAGIKLPENLILGYCEPCFPCVEKFLPEILLAVQQELILNSEGPHPTPIRAIDFSWHMQKSILDLFTWEFIRHSLSSYLCEAGNILRWRFSLTCVSWQWEQMFLDYVAWNKWLSTKEIQLN